MESLETTIASLRAQGISVKNIYDQLGMERGTFESKRNAKKAASKEELAAQIQEAFRDRLTGTVGQSISIEEKYVQALEASVSDLRAERDRLREENLKLLEEIKLIQRKQSNVEDT